MEKVLPPRACGRPEVPHFLLALERPILDAVGQDVDPGWASAASFALRWVVPGARRRSSASGLTIVRGFFLRFTVGIGLAGVAVAVAEATAVDLGSAPEPLVAAVVAALGLGSLLLPRLVDQPLPCDSESALEAAYRQRFFRDMGSGEMAAFVGFAGFMISSAGWLYAVGALFAVFAFARAAPTTRHLGQEERELRLRGCPSSLVSALHKSSLP